MIIQRVVEYGKGYIIVDTDEGRFKRHGGTVSWRCQNRGNLKYGTFAKGFGAVGRDFGGHAVFPTFEDGDKAKYELLFGEKSRYVNQTLIGAMKIYAPEDDPDADNDPATYAKYLARKVGIYTSTKLCDLNETQRASLIKWISVYEGYKVGIVTEIEVVEDVKMETKKKVSLVDRAKSFVGMKKKLGAVGSGAVMGPTFIQNWLAEQGHYHEEVDGDLGKASQKAIDEYLKTLSVNSTAWPKARKVIAIEQAIYKAAGIEVGTIDGKIGPQTSYARDVWEARQTGDKKEIEEVENFRDKPVKNKWPYQSECRTYYGNVGENQTKLILPYPMFIAWDKSEIIKSFSIHEKVHDSAKRCFERIADAYDEEARKKLGLDLFGGCLNVRKMRGGSSWSMHSWGIAIDFDPDRNQLQWGRDRARLAKPDAETFWKIWEEEGWVSLGRARNYDHMHVQAARLD